MGSACGLEIATNAESIVVTVVGDVDMASRPLLHDAIARLGTDRRPLRLDLSGVTFMDSMGLNLLVQVQRLCEVNGGSLTVCSPSAPVRRLFELAGVDGFLTIEG
jgi:anti-sigma B factor antagonist